MFPVDSTGCLYFLDKAFDDSELEVISASDRELIAELMNARPKDPVARSPPSAVLEADVSLQLPVNEMLERATLALEQVAGRPSGLSTAEKVGPKFKLLGAQGRVQQDALNEAFNDDRLVPQHKHGGASTDDGEAQPVAC